MSGSVGSVISKRQMMSLCLSVRTHVELRNLLLGKKEMKFIEKF